ncbi:MAG: ATP-binding protein [Gemmatimonadota bacterium]
MGETRVDILHLLEDLRDAYPGGLEETILTEMVANSLDSGATLIALTADPAAATLTVTDDGTGMKRSELVRFHDIAATTKTRGQGIGFAGVGIKLGLLACTEVLTETRRGATPVATSWHLASRNRAPWKWVPSAGLVAEHGTAVRLTLREPLSPLLESGFIEAALRRHFEPLLDPVFDEVLAAHYPRGVRLVVNGAALARRGLTLERVPLAIRLGRKRKPAAVGYMIRASYPLDEERRGVAISTLGKVIRRGWDWLGVTPGAADRVGGLIEAPALAECLTLNKADFIRSGTSAATYLAYRKAIQEAVAAQLAAWGDSPDALAEASRRRKIRPLERDLHTVLVDLAEEFPLVATLVERGAGGQRRLPIARAGDGGGATAAVPLSVAGGTEPAPELAPAPDRETPEQGEGAEMTTPPPAEPQQAGVPATPAASLPSPARRGPKRPAHYALTVRFESRPDDLTLGRLMESTVWVNEAHPAYVRAAASKSEGYHNALAVAMALAPLAVEPQHAHAFVTAFLTRWGRTLVQGRR